MIYVAQKRNKFDFDLKNSFVYTTNIIMSADKNHEQYLEEVATAVAETTKALMDEFQLDVARPPHDQLREIYRKLAERDVEIKRLKEYQTNDRKTIRNLRGVLKEASEEVENLKKRQLPFGWTVESCASLKEERDEYKEELDIAHFEYEKLKEQLQSSTIAEARSARDNLLLANKSLKSKLNDIFDALDIGGVPEHSSYEDHSDEACEKVEAMMLSSIHTALELEKYKDRIHCVWSDLYWADKAGCDVSFKDISASCDYYDNEDYVKKEVVDDDDA